MTDFAIRGVKLNLFSWLKSKFDFYSNLFFWHIRERRKHREARAAFNNIRLLDDNMLDDIGVKREEVEWALDLPLNVNASKAMYLRAHNRRLKE